MLRSNLYSKLNDTTISFRFSEDFKRLRTDEEILKRWAVRNKNLF